MPTLDNVFGPAKDPKTQKIVDALQTFADDVVSKANALRTALSLFSGDAILSKPGLAIGSSSKADVLAANTIDFQINGKKYDAITTAEYNLTGSAMTASGATEYMAWRLQVGVNGTVDIVAATGNDDGFASAALALAGLAAVEADHAAIGTVVIAATDGTTFTPDTTLMDAAGVTATYADADTLFEDMVAALPAVMT